MVRLYPKTENPEVLEKLAGVATGTAERYAEEIRVFNARKSRWLDDMEKADNERRADLRRNFYDMEEEHYNATHSDLDMAKFAEFKMFGFGRMDTPMHWLDDRRHGWNAGCTTKADEVTALIGMNRIHLHGVEQEALEGLRWG